MRWNSKEVEAAARRNLERARGFPDGLPSQWSTFYFLLSTSLLTRPRSGRAVNLADDPLVMRAHPHAAAAVTSRLVADCARSIAPAMLEPEDERPAQKHQRQHKHRVRRMHGNQMKDNGTGSTCAVKILRPEIATSSPARFARAAQLARIRRGSGSRYFDLVVSRRQTERPSGATKVSCPNVAKL